MSPIVALIDITMKIHLFTSVESGTMFTVYLALLSSTRRDFQGKYAQVACSATDIFSIETIQQSIFFCVFVRVVVSDCSAWHEILVP